MKNNPELWSGCISGAWREDELLAEFERAGFYGMEIVKRESEPWQTVEAIEFRSVTVVAYTGKEGVCLERNQALIYKGPFKQVVDDNDQVFYRGQRMAVCDKTMRLAQQAPYKDAFWCVEPIEEIPLEQAKQFDCGQTAVRDPRQTKGANYSESTCCEGDSCC